MIKKIMLDSKDLHFSKADLPLLIHGDDGYGDSLLSVSVMADYEIARMQSQFFSWLLNGI